MKLPSAPAKYDQETEHERNRVLEAHMTRAYKLGEDVEIASGDATRKQRLILWSPDGTRYEITVSNTGTLGATAI